MKQEFIAIEKAKVHNLKNISLKIPRNQLTVITGPSGSGKSSLAFDTLYAEGQRRYIESLSSYARQFLGQIEPPDVESITGLSPAIAIDQKTNSRNPRSTVGTITEIYDYLRILFARTGTAHCPETGEALESQSPQQIVNSILALPEKTKIQILAPVIQNKKGSHKEQIAKWVSLGFARIRLNGEILNLDDSINIKKTLAHNIDVVVDRLVIRDGIKQRLTDSVELALQLAQGHLIILADDKELYFSEHLYSHKSGKSYPNLEPRLFSFNSPLGACPDCNGLGELKTFTDKSLIFDSSLGVLQGSIKPLQKKSGFLYHMVKSLLDAEDISPNIPFEDLPKKIKNTLLNGSDKIYTYNFRSENSSFNFKKPFPGIKSFLNKKYLESSSEKIRKDLESYMDIEICNSCHGQRLGAYSRSVLINKKSITEISKLDIQQCSDFFKNLKVEKSKKIIADKVLKEINSRLHFLLNVGLDYLTLNRSANTLSGGESQRIRLATQIGSMLSGILYVLDEPSIGLHSRDNQRLISTLISLRDNGNTVIVVEHDEETMLACDHIIDIGPKAGIHGGNIVFEGKPNKLLKDKQSITGKYLSHDLKIEVPKTRRLLDKKICLKEATQNNLSKVDVEFPLEGFCCVTGVSGSGKSTLIHNILVPAIKSKVLKSNRSLYEYSNFKSITGTHQVQSIIELDQAPIGRTPKSNPATYTGLFDLIRTLFSNTPESKVRGYKAGRFSFNLKGGRCESCEGNGQIKIEMHFLPDVFIECSECRGKRYNDETLSILYKGKSIHDILELCVEEAAEFFQHHKKMARILETMCSVGLGYIKLGQPAPTLSGGEAQRLKLSKELSKATRGHCFYVLDEPTTGLHFQDIHLLLNSLQRLVDMGHSVYVIEHNMDVIKTADYLIDLGPEGGNKGGKIVAKGSPEEVAKNKKSITGQFLKKYL